jgi:hypothetical protein
MEQGMEQPQTSEGYHDVERRRFYRIKGAVRVFFRVTESSGRALSRLVEGVTRDISRQGICLQTHLLIVDGLNAFETAMEPEMRLFLEIDLPTHPERVSATGKVIWHDVTSSWQSPRPFCAGIFFTEMEDRDQRVWHAFIDSIL